MKRNSRQWISVTPIGAPNRTPLAHVNLAQVTHVEQVGNTGGRVYVVSGAQPIEVGWTDYGRVMTAVFDYDEAPSPSEAA